MQNLLVLQRQRPQRRIDPVSFSGLDVDLSRALGFELLENLAGARVPSPAINQSSSGDRVQPCRGHRLSFSAEKLKSGLLERDGGYLLRHDI